MRCTTLICLLLIPAGCCSMSSRKAAAELAKVQRERDEYATRLEEAQTLLNYTRWQLEEVKKALNDMYAWRAAAAARLDGQQVADRDRAQVKLQEPLPVKTKTYTVEDPPPNWRDEPAWREAVMKYRRDQARKRVEERRAHTRPTTR